MQANGARKYAEKAFQPVIEKCEGCERIVEENSVRFCTTYISPDAKWRKGICNFATHAKPEIKKVKVRINPLKAAKRTSRRK